MELENLNELLAEKKYGEAKKILSEMNEYDIASLIEELPSDELIKVFRLLPKNIATDVFVNLDDHVQVELIASLTRKESKIIIEDMFTDDVKSIEATRKKITDALRSVLGIGATVKMVAPKTITRSEGKAKRVIDNRKLH